MPERSPLSLPVASPRLWGLDHLRCMAILLVLLFHYGHAFSHPQWAEDWSKFGWTGVDLFFVLSGYLIASQLFSQISRGEGVSLRTFFIKRFLRIIPAYLLVLAVYFCIPGAREREGLAPLWKYLTFTQNLGLDLRYQGNFSHAWSLCIEEQFYLLLPLILAAMVYFNQLKKGLLLLAVFFMVGFALRLFSYLQVAPYKEDPLFGVYWIKRVYYPSYCRLDGLLAGVGLAALYQFRPAVKEKLAPFGNRLLMLGLLLLALAYLVCLDERSFGASVFGFPLVSIGYGLLLLGAINPHSLLGQKKLWLTSQIATLSYALYLSHKIAFHVTQAQLSKPGLDPEGNGMLIASLASAFLLAWLINRLIEMPFLKLRDRLLGIR